MAYNWSYQGSWRPPAVGTGTPPGGAQNPMTQINSWLSGLKKPDTSPLKVPIINDQYNTMTQGKAELGGAGMAWGPGTTPAGEIAGQAAGEALGKFAQADIDAQNAWNETQLAAARTAADIWGRMGEWSGSGSGGGDRGPGGEAFPRGPAPGPASAMADLERQVREKQLRESLKDPTWQEQELANAGRRLALDRIAGERDALRWAKYGKADNEMTPLELLQNKLALNQGRNALDDIAGGPKQAALIAEYRESGSSLPFAEWVKYREQQPWEAWAQSRSNWR